VSWIEEEESDQWDPRVIDPEKAERGRGRDWSVGPIRQCIREQRSGLAQVSGYVGRGRGNSAQVALCVFFSIFFF
jgi:hypothetical protein